MNYLAKRVAHPRERCTFFQKNSSNLQDRTIAADPEESIYAKSQSGTVQMVFVFAIVIESWIDYLHNTLREVRATCAVLGKRTWKKRRQQQQCESILDGIPTKTSLFSSAGAVIRSLEFVGVVVVGLLSQQQ